MAPETEKRIIGACGYPGQSQSQSQSPNSVPPHKL